RAAGHVAVGHRARVAASWLAQRSLGASPVAASAPSAWGGAESRPGSNCAAATGLRPPLRAGLVLERRDGKMMLQDDRVQPFRLTLRTLMDGTEGGQRDGVLISLLDDKSHVGRGEATPLVAFGTEPLSSTTTLLNEICGHLRGLPVPATCEEVERLLGNFPQLTSAPATRCGLESALLDLAAQHAQRPLASFLCASPRGFVPVSALLIASEP